MASWPAEASQLHAAERFLLGPFGAAVVACHSDVDGLTSALIVRRVLTARQVRTSVVISARGEHVHSPSMRRRIVAVGGEVLIVTDMGTRPLPLQAGVPALVIDHHDASGGVPSDALMVNGFDRPPVAPSSVLAFTVVRGLPGAAETCWLAALGALADLGTVTPFKMLLPCRVAGPAARDAIALLNAARRAPADDAQTAFDVLERARSVEDIATGRVEGVARLREYRALVSAEVQRCSRVAPRVLGGAALIRFSSGAQVHPVVAIKWTRRLAPAIVIAANDGYLPGRVNFAIRCAADVNLLEWLRALPFTPADDGEFANGHARATGGSLTPRDFETLVAAIREAPVPQA